MADKVACDVCGRLRSRHGCRDRCKRCGLLVCDVCWNHQACKGHGEAEHGNEAGWIELMNLRVSSIKEQRRNG